MLKRFGRAFVVILIAIAGTYALNRLGMLHTIERLVLDEELAAGPHPSKDIVVINITDADYDNLFGGQSPLRPKELHDLIGAINRSSPAVIAVDIDTSHPQFSRDFKVEEAWRNRVIWERDVSPNEVTSGTEFAPLDVLGGSDPSLNQNSGIPLLLDDPEDKVTRFYTRCVDTKAGPKPSFVYAVVAAYRAWGTPVCTGGVEKLTQPFLIQFPLKQGSTLVFRDAAQVLGLSGTTADGTAANVFSDFQGKIVLLGGSYRDLDRHYTPIGPLPGVAVLANAIQTELEGSPMKARSRALLFLIEFLSGVLVVFVLSIVGSPAKAFALGLVMALGIPLVLSLALFRTPSRFVIFAPTLISVLIFETLEHIRHKSLVSAFGSGRGA